MIVMEYPQIKNESTNLENKKTPNMTSYYKVCVSRFHPNSIFAEQKQDYMERMNSRHVKDTRINLGPNAKAALRECQSIIKNSLTSPDTNELYDDMCLELDDEELKTVCALLDRKNGDESRILLRHLKMENPSDFMRSHAIHFFKGQGLTACGKKTGDVAYLIGEKTYCKDCLLATI